MAKKMRVVVRRKDNATAAATATADHHQQQQQQQKPLPSGACILPFAKPSKAKTAAAAVEKKRSSTPGRKRTASSNASSNSDVPFAKETPPSSASTSPNNYNFTDWEAAFEKTPVFPAVEQPLQKSNVAADFNNNNNNNNTSTSNTAFSVSGETTSTQPMSSWSASASQRTPGSPDRSVDKLLSLPTPKDRSDRRRLQYEREKRQQGLYEGELEPAGTRGQEAQVAPGMGRKQSGTQAPKATQPPNNNNNAPQIRSFDERPPSTERKNFAGKQVTLVLPPLHPSDQLNRPETPVSSAHSKATSSSKSNPKRDASGAPPLPETNAFTRNASETAPKMTRESPAHRSSRASPSHGAPIHNTSPRSRPRVTTVVDDSSAESSSQLSSSQLIRKELRPPVQLHTGTGKVVRGQQVLDTPSNGVPSAYYNRGEVQNDDDDYDDDESTRSDDELRQMHADLMPSFSVDMEVDRPHEVPSPYRASRGPSPAAAAAAKAAAAALEQQSKRDTPDEQIEQLNEAAMDAVQDGSLNDAVEMFGKVLSMQKALHGSKHPAVASAYHNLGTVQAKRAAALSDDAVAQQLCRTSALEAFQAAARTARDSLGPSHPNVAVSLVRIGFLLLHSRQYSNALITFAEALRIRLTAFGKKHALTANLYNNLGVCHMHMEEFDQGRRALHAGLVIQRLICAESDAKAKSDGSVPWLELADTLFNIGGLCLEWIRKQGPDLRRAEESEDSFAEAYEIRLRILGPDDPSTEQVRELLAKARSIPRPRPRSNSPGPRRWRSEEAVALYEPPSTPIHDPPSVQRRTMSPISQSMTPMSALTMTPSSKSAQAAPSTARLITPDLYDYRRMPYATPDTSRPSDEGYDGLTSIERHREQQTNEIFRSRSSSSRSSKRSSKVLTPPVMEVTFSQDSDPNGESNESAGSGDKKERGATRIYMSSHLVPGAPLKPVDKQGIQERLKNASFDNEVQGEISNDLTTGEIATRLFRSHEYDNEENCLINDSGVDSEHGRVHYPLAWNKAGLQTTSESNHTNSRDIVVTRPFRNPSIKSSSSLSEKWGSETVNMGEAEETFSTGNKERDEIMSRAKAILASHEPRSPESPAKVDQSTSVEPSGSTDHMEEEFGLSPNKKVNEELLMEDGLAPLGGKWTSSGAVWKKSQMLADPMNYLPTIHEEASKQLSNDNFVDAIHLFDEVLQCQKRRNGPIHADVASALYNLGIAQLRSQNHGEALKAFEETARIRKNTLGREHPDVAVSLVKVGITLLLLHRFEEALWSFREALSVRRHALGPTHPSTARIFNNIGCVHVEFNEFREARKAFESALDIQRNALCGEPESGALMFGAATTLCNLGYLYRYRGLHAKAALVLKEAVDLQETVLGRSHATVLSTLDNLADSCASSGQATDSLRHYNTILTRFRLGGRSGSQKVLRAEAVLLYKMSRVHRQRNDLDSQLDSLKLALRAVRALSDPQVGVSALERRILYDIRSCRERIEKSDLKWV